MKKCLRIMVSGHVQGVGYPEFVQKKAQQLSIEGTVQHTEDGKILILARGVGDNLDSLIDILYQGTERSKVNDIIAESLMGERNFRGVFRIIGSE